VSDGRSRTLAREASQRTSSDAVRARGLHAPSPVSPTDSQNKKVVYDLLFQPVQKHCSKLPASPTSWRRNWLLSVLHSWSQKLDLHHMCIAWCRPVDFLPIARIGSSHPMRSFFLSRCSAESFAASSSRHSSMLFRTAASVSRRLATPDSAENLCCVAETTISKGLGVYAKPPFGGPGACTPLSGRYTHRVAISNHRLISFSDGRSPFVGAIPPTNNEQKLMTLSLDEFLRRFLLHLLPEGFVPSATSASWPTANGHHLATFLPTARRDTANPAKGLHRRSERSLVLPQVWWSMMVVERLTTAESNFASTGGHRAA